MSAINITVDSVLMKRGAEIKPFVVLDVDGKVVAITPETSALVRAELERAEIKLATGLAGAIAAPDLVGVAPAGAA